MIISFQSSCFRYLSGNLSTDILYMITPAMKLNQISYGLTLSVSLLPRFAHTSPTQNSKSSTDLHQRHSHRHHGPRLSNSLPPIPRVHFSNAAPISDARPGWPGTHMAWSFPVHPSPVVLRCSAVPPRLSSSEAFTQSVAERPAVVHAPFLELE